MSRDIDEVYKRIISLVNDNFDMALKYPETSEEVLHKLHGYVKQLNKINEIVPERSHETNKLIKKITKYINIVYDRQHSCTIM